MDERELLQAIMDSQLGRESEEGDDNAWTTKEIVQMTNMHESRARDVLKGLLDKGYAEVLWVKRDDLRTPLTGTQSRRPGYRLTDKGREALKGLVPNGD